MLDRQNYANQRTIWESAKLAAQQEKSAYDLASAALPSMEDNLKALEQREAELEALLAQVKVDIQTAKQKIADHPNTLIAHKEKVKAAILHAKGLKKELKPVDGSDAADAAIIDEADLIRIRAIEAIKALLGQ